MISSIAALSGPKWRILGTQGALESTPDGEGFTVVSYASGLRQARGFRSNG